MKSEKQTEKYLRDKIIKLKGLCIKFTSPGMQGVPDRIIILFGKIFFVELKAPTGKLSEVQKSVHQLFKALGFPVYVLSSEQEVDEFINLITLL